MSGDGVYTAAAATGTYWVVATDSVSIDSVRVTVVAPRRYDTRFASNENPISENGAWINGGREGVDWTNVSIANGHAVGHQVAASYTDATALLRGAWPSNQLAEAVVFATHPLARCYQEVELRLRSAITSHRNTGYEIAYSAWRGPTAYVLIVRWNGRLGDFTYLVNARGARYGVSDGDTVRATIIGDVITAWRNGERLAEATDTTFSEGAPGIGFNLENQYAGCSGTNPAYGFTAFSAAPPGNSPASTSAGAAR